MTMDEKNLQKGGLKLRKPNNAIFINTSMEGDFFKWWCTYLRSQIKLTDREADVVASFLKFRWELSKSILDPAILDAMVMSDDTKKRVIEDCHITLQHFYVVMSNLRKNKIIIGNSLNPSLIPNIKEDDDGTFQLLILFKDKGKEK